MKKHKTSNLLLAVCPDCGKRVLHPRGSEDPKRAIWCHLKCEDCVESGDKDYSTVFYGEHGYMEYDHRWYFPLWQEHIDFYKMIEKEQHNLNDARKYGI